MTDEAYEKTLHSWRTAAMASINWTFEENSVDISQCPGDARFSTLATYVGRLSRRCCAAVPSRIQRPRNSAWRFSLELEKRTSFRSS